MMNKKINIDYGAPVLTSKYIISQQSAIVYVAHHEDGTWEFWGAELVDESEVMIISWKEIIEIDYSVLEVADLPIEFNAVRDELGKPWKIVSKN
jgi:hypothetical protein